MRRSLFVLVGAGALAVAAAALPAYGQSAPGRPGPAAQLRYIGRDHATGMPVPVNDRFIAAFERSYELYGIEEFKPVPPPAVTGADVARVVIPAIGVDNRVGRYGLDGFGRIDIPQDRTTVGWNPGFTDLPGEGGATFFAAHYEFQGQPGVFNRLSSLAEGDEVRVLLTDGSEPTYRVTSVVDYDLASIDMGALLAGREGVESITLMTCSGPRTGQGFAERTVVLAARVE